MNPKLPEGWEVEEEKPLPEGWEVEEPLAASLSEIAPEPAALSPESQSGTAVRGFGQGASLGFADEMAGLSGAVQELASRGPAGRALAALPAGGPLLAIPRLAAAPQVLTGSSRELGEFSNLGPIDALMARYRSDRDRARAEMAAGARANPKTAVASQIAGGLMLPIPGAGGARTAASIPTLAKGGAAMGLAAGLGGTQADLTRGEGGRALFDAATSAAMGGAGGALAGGLGRLAAPLMRRGGNVIGDTVATRAAQDVDEVAAEVATLKGQLGAETQKGSRILRNLKEGVEGLAPSSVPAGISPQLQAEAIQAINSADAAALRAGTLEQSLVDLPSQLSTVAARRAAFQQAAASAPQTAARRTQDYFTAPLVATEVAPRLSRLGQRAATGAGVGLLSGALGALGGSAAGGDPLSAGLGAAAAGFGAVMGGPGTLQMMRNVAASPRVGAAAAETAVRALGQVPQVVGRASTAATTSASNQLSRPSPLRPDEQESVDAFLTAP